MDGVLICSVREEPGVPGLGMRVVGIGSGIWIERT